MTNIKLSSFFAVFFLFMCVYVAAYPARKETLGALAQVQGVFLYANGAQVSGASPLPSSTFTVIPLSNWLFLGQGGAYKVTGYFVNVNGQDGPSWTPYTVPAANGTQAGVSIATIAATTIPTDAIGFKITSTTGPIYKSEGGASQSSDFTTNYANYTILPTLAAGSGYYSFGRNTN